MADTTALMREWVNAAPKRGAEVARMLREAGLSEEVIAREVKLKVSRAEPPGDVVATFDPAVMRTPSPMLRERLAFAGSIRDAVECWPALADLKKAIQRPALRRTLRSMADHWQGSVPATVAPGQVSLLAYSPSEPDFFTLLVWPGAADEGEPAVVRYAGQSESRFDCIDEFLRWASSQGLRRNAA